MERLPVTFIWVLPVLLFLNYEYGNQKRHLIGLNTYQSENKSRAIFLHLLNQETKVLKARAEGEVQLPVHVIDVYMLDILQEEANKIPSVLQQYSQGTLTALPESTPDAAARPAHISLFPFTNSSILLTEITFCFCSQITSLTLPSVCPLATFTFPCFNSCLLSLQISNY